MSIESYFKKKPKSRDSSATVSSETSITTTCTSTLQPQCTAFDEGRTENGEDIGEPQATSIGPEKNTKGEPCGLAASSLLDKPNQPKNFIFPKKPYGKQNRSFQKVWFEEYPWLHYSEEKDVAYCYICINQNIRGNLTSAKNLEKAFISTGYSNWKKALLRFKEHQSSECHNVAVHYEMVIPKTQPDIAEITNAAIKKTRLENRQCFAKVIESLQYLARQGIAIRGTEDDKESNFVQLLKLRSKDDISLTKWIESKGDNYCSHDIQNEILGIMANQVIRSLVSDIGRDYFSTMCDEYTDIANKEQLTFCLRWVDQHLEAHEDFIGFYGVPDIAATTITSAIQDILARINLSLSRCRGQCYDGASNMLGKKSGVAQRIQALQPKAVATHCHGHSLNLGMKDTVKSCKLLSDTLNTAKELVTLIKYSPKRENMLGEVKDNIVEEEDKGFDEKAVGGILKLCPTRWTVRAACFERILANYGSLLKTWEVSLGTNLVSEVRARIIGCESQMKRFEFFFGLSLSQRIFAHTDNLSKTLQSPRMSAASGQHLARLTTETLENIRNEESFNAFYDAVLIKVKQHPEVSDPVVPRKRRIPQRYEPGSAAPEYPVTARDHYRQIFYEAMDLAISSIRERFNQPAFKVYASLENLLLKAAKGEDIEVEMKDLQAKYEEDVNISRLDAQLVTYKVLMQGKDFRCFQDVLIALKDLQLHEKLLINEVIVVAKLIYVNPATSATGERSFSTARRIKTWLRSTMTQDRLNHLSVLNTHKERLDSLQLHDIANQFVALNENRHNKFGKFTPDDFSR